MRYSNTRRNRLFSLAIYCWGPLLVCTYLLTGINDKGSLANFLLYFNQTSLFVHHALLLLTIPVSILFGHLYSRQEVLTKELGKKVIEKASLLHSSEVLFSKLINLIPDPVVIVDSKGIFLETNASVDTKTGFSREDLLGKNIFAIKILSNKSKALVIKNLAKRMLGVQIEPYEIEVFGKNGEKMLAEINAAKIEWNGKFADMVILRDITERKNVEEKLRVIEQITRHDIRNKIQTLLIKSFLAKNETEKNVLKHLDEIDTVCRQITRIFDFARDYQKLEREEPTYIKIDEAVEEAISLLNDKQKVTIRNNCNGLKVLADSLLTRIFYNLMDNSLKHGEKVTKIAIHYKDEGDNLKIFYEDNGIGIPIAEKKRIFEEGIGKGSGYGLYLCLKICNSYRWEMQEEGEKGKGVRFIITIPIRISSKEMPAYQLVQQIRS